MNTYTEDQVDSLIDEIIERIEPTISKKEEESNPYSALKNETKRQIQNFLGTCKREKDFIIRRRLG